jgi:protein TonB
MLERVRKDGSGKRRGAALVLAFGLHAGAVVLLLMAGGAVVKTVAEEAPLVLHLPAAARHGGGDGSQAPVKKATPKKIAKHDFQQPETIATPEAVAIASPEATPDDGGTTSVPGGPGVGPGPGGPGTPDGTCEGPSCTGDCVGPNCSNEPFDPKAFGITPTALFQPQPAYPAAARGAGLTGQVVVEIIVGVDGSVKNARVVSGSSMFAVPALEAVRQWRYMPVSYRGQPIVWKSTVTLKFQLH